MSKGSIPLSTLVPSFAIRDLSRKIFSTSPECLDTVKVIRVPLFSSTCTKTPNWKPDHLSNHGTYKPETNATYQAVSEALP